MTAEGIKINFLHGQFPLEVIKTQTQVVISKQMIITTRENGVNSVYMHLEMIDSI